MVEDQAQRLQAIVPELSFIVQAPAGSGKTELLIQRYLRLLSLVEEPEEIIAITFTRKAAAEMQGRILSALERTLKGEKGGSEHDQLTLQLACTALKRDKKLKWDIIENPMRLRIQTIDALCGGLSRQMPILAKLGSQPETIDDPRPLYEQAASNTLLELDGGQNWSVAIARLLEHLDNDLPRLKRLLVIMLSKRDQWLRYVSGQHDRADMERALQDIICEQLRLVSKYFPSEFEPELSDLARFAAKNLQESKANNEIAACLTMESLPGTEIDDLPLWQGIRELLLTQNGTWRKRLNKTNGFPAPSENKLEADLRKSMKVRIETLLQKLMETSGLQQALNQLRYLPSAQYLDEEWQVVGALCQLLLLAEAQLRLIFSERNQMDFTGITQAAIEALGGDESPTDLALHLDHQIHHLLVDEYQDISLNQYVLLQQLVAGWSADEQKSLFLVGDPMQSIYRFREAEVALFIKTWQQQRLAQLPLVPLRLTVNFRSSSSIVEWVNKQFKHIMPDRDDLMSGAVSYCPSIAYDKTLQKDSVQIKSFPNRTDRQEAQVIVSIINSIRQYDKEGQIGILVRSRSHLLEILPALREADIAYQAIELEPLMLKPVIQDLLILTRAYTHLADRTAWLALLRAPWCGLQLEPMLMLFAGNRDRTIWQCMNDEKLIQKLDQSTQKRINQIKSLFISSLKNQQRFSLRRSVEMLWLQLGGPATLENVTDLEDAQAFFDVLHQFDEGGNLKELKQLINSLADLYAGVDTASTDKLQLMSMHKAKGLEFDHVILPGLGKRSRYSQNELMMWTVNSEEQLIMAPIKEAGSDEGDIYNYIKQLEQRKQSYEDARLLYVAATRARQSLYLSAHAVEKVDKKTGEVVYAADKRSLLNHLWPSISDSFISSLSQDESDINETETILVEQSNRRFPLTWTRPIPETNIKTPSINQEEANDKTLIEYEWASDNIKHVGSTVHRFIQFMADEGIDNWNTSRIKQYKPLYKNYLKQLGVSEKEIEETSQRVQEALLKMINDERGQWLLSSEHKEANNEYELSGIYKNKIINIKIDRTFVDENNVRWIIDYKTSRHDEADVEAFLDQQQTRYQEQLEKYAIVMKSLDDRAIKLGLYFPLLNGWREWQV